MPESADDTRHRSAPVRPDHSVASGLLDIGLEAVLFDLDGVVTRTASSHAQAWEHLFNEYLAEHAAGEREGRPGKPHPDTFLRAAALMGVDPSGAAVVEDARREGRLMTTTAEDSIRLTSSTQAYLNKGGRRRLCRDVREVTFHRRPQTPDRHPDRVQM